MIRKRNVGDAISNEEDLKKFLFLMRDSLLLSNLAIGLWEAIAEKTIARKFNQIHISLLGYNQRMYYGTIISELSKIYDPHSKTFSYYNAKSFCLTKEIDIHEILKIEKEVEDIISLLRIARNKFIAHNDQIQKSSDISFDMSIQDLSYLVKKSICIYELFFECLGENVTLVISKPREVTAFNNLLDKISVSIL